MAQARVKKTAKATAESRRTRMREILRILKRAYPDAECSLTHRGPFQLLVATILSAQCTDERVNRVTPNLFAKYPDPESLAGAKVADVEELIRSTNFFRNKAIAMIEASKTIVAEHEGKVPKDLEALVKLRGVGRKTANVVLGVAYGIGVGVVVDTHVGRLSRRMGFTREADPVKVEQDLIEITPREDWVEVSHLMIFHGRAICTARRALCEDCPVASLCPKIGV